MRHIVSNRKGHKQPKPKLYHIISKIRLEKQHTIFVIYNENGHKTQGAKCVIVYQLHRHNKQRTKLIICDQKEWAQEAHHQTYHIVPKRRAQAATHPT